MTARTVVLSAARWLALLVPLVDVALVLTRVLSRRAGIVVALVLESLLAVVLVVEAAASRRAYRPRGGTAPVDAQASWRGPRRSGHRWCSGSPARRRGSCARCGGRSGDARTSAPATCRCPTPAASASCSAR